MEADFTRAVRRMLEALYTTASEPAIEPGGGLAHVLSMAGPRIRRAVQALAERWFGPAEDRTSKTSPAVEEPILNRPEASEDERIRAVLVDHFVRRRPWSYLSTNESTFYRYRRTAIAAFSEALWAEITRRPIPVNRPRPEFEQLIGREAELGQVLAALASPVHTVVAIEGPGGIGKTALAQATVNACLAAGHNWRPVPLPSQSGAVPIFDACVWLAPAESSLTLADALDTLARVLDYPGLLVGSGTFTQLSPEASRRARERLRLTPTLLVLDNFEQVRDPAVLSFLLTIPPPSRALVLSRRRIQAQTHILSLGPLEPAQTLELLRLEGARYRLAHVLEAPEEQLRSLAEAVGHIPLAAIWAAGQIRQGQSLERIRDRLAQAEGVVFEQMFASSLDLLSESARQVLAALPVFVAPVSRVAVLAAAESLEAGERSVGGRERRLDAGLDELVEISLVQVRGSLAEAGRRYDMHPLARAFARQRLWTEPAIELRGAFGAGQYYRDLIHQYGGPATQSRHYGRIEEEIDQVLAILDQAARFRRLAPPAGAPRPVEWAKLIVDWAEGLRNVFRVRGLWRAGLTVFEEAFAAARQLGDDRAAGWNAYRLAAIQYDRRPVVIESTARWAEQALADLQQAGDERGVGHSLRLLGRLAREQGDFATAERYLNQATARLAEYGHGDDLAITQASRADLLRRSGRLAEARALYTALANAELHDLSTRANVLENLAAIDLAEGHWSEAETGYQVALALASELGQRLIQAECAWGLAQLHRQRGERAAASTWAQQAVELFERLGLISNFQSLPSNLP